MQIDRTIVPLTCLFAWVRLCRDRGPSCSSVRNRSTLAGPRTRGGHTGEVETVAYSPDGRLLAFGRRGSHRQALEYGGQSMDGARWPATRDGWPASPFSPDGKDAGQRREGLDHPTLECREPGSARPRLSGHRNEILTLAFSPDGKTLASAGAENRNPALERLGGGRPARTLTGHFSAIRFPGVRAQWEDRSRPRTDRTSNSGDVAKGIETMSLDLGFSSTGSLAFSPDGMRLAAGGQGRLRPALGHGFQAETMLQIRVPESPWSPLRSPRRVGPLATSSAKPKWPRPVPGNGLHLGMRSAAGS